MTTLSMPPVARYAARTDVGRRREHNEDRFLARPTLFVIADGLGGRNAGEVAAQLLVDDFEELLAGRTGSDALRETIELSGRRIASQATVPERAGMSTTCVAIQLDGAVATVAHVGDSRAYLLRGGMLRPLTDDHTVVGELVRGGLLAPEDAAVDDRRHMLTQALGAVDRLDVATMRLALQPGDRLLLCSDGLSGLVGDLAIEDVLSTVADPGVAADALVDRANEAGGTDNVTVIVVDPDVDDDAASAAAAQVAAERERDAPRAASAPRRRQAARVAAAVVGLLILFAVGLVLGTVVVPGLLGAPGPGASPAVAVSPVPSASPVPSGASGAPPSEPVAPSSSPSSPGASGAPSAPTPRSSTLTGLPTPLPVTTAPPRGPGASGTTVQPTP